MNILINASNLKVGGGVQVAYSIISELSKYTQHHFVVAYPDALENAVKLVKDKDNISTVKYNMSITFKNVFFLRDSFLDRLVDEKNIDAVLTVFGPSRWRPKVKHLCGFARAQLVVPESPFFTRMPFFTRIKTNIKLKFLKYNFQQSSENFWTENSEISERLSLLLKGVKVYTVTNYYNQIFDQPEKWNKKVLSSFDGCSLLTISYPYPHKNLGITIEIAKVLKKKYSDFKFRFIITIDKNSFYEIPQELSDCFELIGKVDITECPSLYEQANIMFLPTLIESFSASYPEAMRMNVPIVTTDLGFARGLCGDAAAYYSALSAEDAADVIYRVYIDFEYRNNLIINGKIQLNKYDSYENRTSKLFSILEKQNY